MSLAQRRPPGTLLPSWEASADVVVVGTGVAGLTAALTTASAGLSVLLITKGRPEEASTQWAQGGVAVVRDERDPGDSIDDAHRRHPGRRRRPVRPGRRRR